MSPSGIWTRVGRVQLSSQPLEQLTSILYKLLCFSSYYHFTSLFVISTSKHLWRPTFTGGRYFILNGIHINIPNNFFRSYLTWWRHLFLNLIHLFIFRHLFFMPYLSCTWCPLIKHTVFFAWGHLHDHPTLRWVILFNTTSSLSLLNVLVGHIASTWVALLRVTLIILHCHSMLSLQVVFLITFTFSPLVILIGHPSH